MLAVAMLAGCQTAAHRLAVAPAKDQSGSASVETKAAPSDGRWHSVVIKPPDTLPEIHTWNKLNPVWWFENADDPRPPAWYRPKGSWRKTTWAFRNPLHNFTFYVIGVADKQFVRNGRYPRATANPKGGWNVALTRRRLVVLPYASYKRGRFEFYFGWRVRGNFGAKINVTAAKDMKAWQTEPVSPDDPFGIRKGASNTPETP